VFDNMLITRVSSILNPSGIEDRYKPRYIYNLLMRNANRTNQQIIDDAYSTRGLHFTPRATSVGYAGSTVEKNRFRIDEPIHVMIDRCPQNTPITIYVVEDQDYTDGMNVNSLTSVVATIPGRTGPDGRWFSTAPLMMASVVGDYDIIVDVGNNGFINFEYLLSNVRDGFDGLNGPGFQSMTIGLI